MTTAVVTGLTGQDGSYLLERLVAETVHVHGVIRPGDPDPVLPGGTDHDLVRLHRCDLADAAGLARIVDDAQPDEIYNLGGISSVAFSWQEPLLTAQVSGLGPGVLLEAARRTQDKLGRAVRFVQASSAEIFGSATDVPQTEATPVRPTTPYGAAKAYAHQLVGVYRAMGLFATSCVLYNHESPRRPDTFVTRKITKGVAEIRAGRRETLTLGNTDARRDWGWAPDYVDAMIRAVRADRADDFVVASGHSHSVLDFAAAAFAAAGVTDWRDRIAVDENLRRPNDATEQVGDARKIRDTLGWQPTRTFAEVVSEMVSADLAALQD